MASLIIALAGTRHGHAGQFPQPLRSGTPVRLVREADNRFDKNAIAAWVRRDALGDQAPPENRLNMVAWRLGFVPAKASDKNYAALLAPLMDRGVELTAKIQQHRGTSVVIEISAPEGVDLARLEGAAAR
jgi:HIRAN domain-containing protein